MKFVGFRVEGGLLSEEVVEALLRGELGGQRPRDFGLANDRELERDMTAAWSEANASWASLNRRLVRLRPEESRTGVTRDLWLVPLLTNLGFELSFQRAAVDVDGLLFPISHRGGPGTDGPPVQLEGVDTDLDHRPRGRRWSPHAVVQEYLNRTEHLWGVVSNGRKLRVLRQTARLSRPSYLEFDLEAIFEGGRFDEFRLLYRLVHRSRFPRPGAEAAHCWLERYYEESVTQGGRVREHLRDRVQEALKRFGNGFLKHPANEALRTAIDRGELTEAGYYTELLRLVYRLLFLFVAEERGLLLPAGDARVLHVWERAYSPERLRRLAERPIEESRFSDLWLGLVSTFRLLGSEEAPRLGLPALDGTLFSPEALPHLEEAHLWNHDLLRAVQGLSLFHDHGVTRRINYAALDVEELGSVYESLLDYRPVLERSGQTWQFDLAPGSERKSTGSYYTPPELVRELVESALVPVLNDRLGRAKTREEKEAAILGLKVLDPASGSGHFLLAAGRRLGQELARIRADGEEPGPEAVREATRDVIEHCLYAVDVNPLAVELCKLALWIEGHHPGRPLSFLDHHVRCGNSLIGLRRLDVLRDGIPDQAYAPVTGDDKRIAASIRKENATLRRGQLRLSLATDLEKAKDQLAENARGLAGMASKTVAEVRAKDERFRESRAPGGDWWRLKRAADLWTAAFLLPLTRETTEATPRSDDVWAALDGQALPEALTTAAEQAAERYRFFHWPLEFPDAEAQGGFDVVLGNPPWERTKLEEKQFFASRDRAIAEAPNKARRQEMIARLETEKPELWREFQEAKHAAEAEAKFVRGSGRFPLTGVGDLNTYGLFVELAHDLLGPQGRLGMVVPTGIATDHTYRNFFAKVTEEKSLASLLDFENREGLFPEVDATKKFCLLTLSRTPVEQPSFAFFCHRTEELDHARIFSLAPEDLALIHPNTRTLPIFRTRVDAELTRKIYRRVPVLINRRTGENPWGIRFIRLFDMANDSHLFFGRPAPGRLPLYEAKLFHQYDHRWATYENGRNRHVLPEEKADPGFQVTPRYWVEESEVLERLPEEWDHRWFIAFRDITRPTEVRTVIAAVLPWAGVGNKAPLVISPWPAEVLAALVGNLNSLVLDYAARQTVAGTTLNYFLIEQLPVLPPDSYNDGDYDFIVPRFLELTCTARDIQAFAQELGWEAEPYQWDEERRAFLRAELDAYYAHLYGLTREELRYILDPQEVYGEDFPGETFRVLKENEVRRYGEYRTRRLVLEAYDRLAGQFAKQERKGA